MSMEVVDDLLTHHAPPAPKPDVTFVGDLDSGVAAATASGCSTIPVGRTSNSNASA
jgi:hypothetical protein